MTPISFSLEFFAERMMTTPDKLHYCIIRRTYHNAEYGHYQVPGIRVEGITHHAYSLFEGSFVALGEVLSDSVITMEDAEVAPTEQGYLFRTVSGNEAHFRTEELLGVWYTRLVNDQLK